MNHFEYLHSDYTSDMSAQNQFLHFQSPRVVVGQKRTDQKHSLAGEKVAVAFLWNVRSLEN